MHIVEAERYIGVQVLVTTLLLYANNLIAFGYFGCLMKENIVSFFYARKSNHSLFNCYLFFIAVRLMTTAKHEVCQVATICVQ